MMSSVHHLLLHPTLFPISPTCSPNSSLHLAPRMPLAVDWTNFRVSNQSSHWNSKSESSVAHYLLFSSSSLASSHSFPPSPPSSPPSPLHLAPTMTLAADWTNFRVMNQSTHWNSKSESSVDHYLLLVVGKMPIYTTDGLLKGGCGNLQFLLYMVNVLHCAPLMILPVHTSTDE